MEITAQEELAVNSDFKRGKVGWKGKDDSKVEVVKEKTEIFFMSILFQTKVQECNKTLLVKL